jgi:Zn-dependent peptidase ImmA (M78 family)
VATNPDVLSAMRAEREALLRVRPAVRKLMKYWDLTDSDLAAAFGVSRQAINYRINGRTVIHEDDAAGFAAYFRVPKEILRMAPDDALRYVLDHPECGPPSMRGKGASLSSAVA